MTTSNFKDWTLSKLDKTFGMKQIWDCKLMDKWETLATTFDISDFEEKTIIRLQNL